MNREPVIEMKNISKNFGGLQALKNVDLTLSKGEVLGVVGSNGAGKSTLIKVLTGVYSLDEGEVYVYGKKQDINKPIDARNIGIETIYQDLALIPEFNPVQNIFMARDITKWVLGFRVLDKRKMETEARETLKKIGIEKDIVRSKIKNLSGGQQQAVAISRAIYWDAEIIIMDEPTAALGVAESERVYSMIKQLKRNGISIIVISHNIEEIFQVCDKVLVLRLGKRVAIKETASSTKEEIVRLIVGA